MIYFLLHQLVWYSVLLQAWAVRWVSSKDLYIPGQAKLLAEDLLTIA